jgi:hypothetical protein
MCRLGGVISLGVTVVRCWSSLRLRGRCGRRRSHILIHSCGSEKQEGESNGHDSSFLHPFKSWVTGELPSFDLALFGDPLRKVPMVWDPQGTTQASKAINFSNFIRNSHVL